MSLTNTARPSAPSLDNSARVSTGETWATWTTSWATETRTWDQLASELDNTSKPRTLGSYTFDEIGTDLISEHGGAMDDSSDIINTAKPS